MKKKRSNAKVRMRGGLMRRSRQKEKIEKKIKIGAAQGREAADCQFSFHR